MLKTITNRLLKLPIKSGLPRFFLHQNNKDNLNSQNNLVNDEIKTNHAISKNVGMNQFLMRVYNTTGLSILGALGSSYMFMSMPFVCANFGMTSIVGLIMTLGGFIGANSMQPTNLVEKINGV